MKEIKSLILLTSIIVFFGSISNLSAGISSRIEGVIVDRDTNQPIEGARVVLYLDNREYKSTKTDKKGYFKFEQRQVIAGQEYYIQCSAKGYIPFLPEYYSSEVKSEYFNEIFRVFNLREGQIKHLKISLEKGGILKGTIFKKDASGTSSFKDVTLFLKKKKKPDEYFLEDNEQFIVESSHTDENGEFIFFDLEPSDDSISDEYVIDLDKSGYVLPIVRNIKIKKSEETQLDYTVEFANLPVIKGTVRINGELPMKGTARLYSLFPVEEDAIKTFGSELDENGNYFFYGIRPGKYELVIKAYYAWNKKCKDKRIVNIVKGQTNTQNFNLNMEK
jgi:hypothetical protein